MSSPLTPLCVLTSDARRRRETRLCVQPKIHQRCRSRKCKRSIRCSGHVCPQELFGFYVSLLCPFVWGLSKTANKNKHILKVQKQVVCVAFFVIHSNGEKALQAPVFNIAARLRWTGCFVKTCSEHVGNHLQCSPLKMD